MKTSVIESSSKQVFLDDWLRQMMQTFLQTVTKVRSAQLQYIAKFSSVYFEDTKMAFVRCLQPVFPIVADTWNRAVCSNLTHNWNKNILQERILFEILL